MKLFAPLPLHVFHLSLCLFLPFWVSLVLHGFLAEGPQITLSVPCFRSRSPLLCVSFLSGLSQRGRPPGTAQTPRAGLRSRRLWFRNSHKQTGTAAREGSGALLVRPGRAKGANGTSGARPQRPREPQGAALVAHSIFDTMLAPGPRHSPMERRVRLPSARLCCWGAHGVEREPGFAPWCHGERAVLPISCALNPTGSCFPFPRETGSVAVPEKCVSLFPNTVNDVRETSVALGRVSSFWQCEAERYSEQGRSRKTGAARAGPDRSLWNCCETPALPVSLGWAAGEPKPFKSRSEVEVTINLCSCCRHGTAPALPLPPAPSPSPSQSDSTCRR